MGIFDEIGKHPALSGVKAVGGLFGGGGDDDHAAEIAAQMIAQNKALYDGIKMPKYADFNPELYQSGESMNAQTVSEDPGVKSQQMAALAKLSGLADTGLSAVDEAAFAKARNEGSQMARAGSAAAMQNAEARGVGGSGLEFAMREMANQGGAQRSQEAGLDRAAAAAKERALMSQAYGEQLGQVRGQDFNVNRANTDTINQFNQMNTQRRNTVADSNVGAKNNAFQYNQGLQDKTYQNELGKADRISGFNNQQATIAMQDEEQKRRAKQAQNGMIGGLIGAGAGAMVGGPAGAQIGGSLGSGIGSNYKG